MKSIIKQLYTILLVTVACLTVTGCSDDFKSGLRLDGDVWVNSIRLDEYAGTVDYQNKAIVVGVPYDYDITRMVVTEMNLSEGAKASIAIGETIDFSLPVSLTVKNVYRSGRGFADKSSLLPEQIFVMQMDEFMKRRYEFRFNQLTTQDRKSVV